MWERFFFGKCKSKKKTVVSWKIICYNTGIIMKKYTF